MSTNQAIVYGALFIQVGFAVYFLIREIRKSDDDI